MTTTLNPTTVEISPSYRIPLVLLGLGLLTVPLSLWVAAPVIVFSLFLTLQTATIRLRFTPESLAVYRSGTQIRDFPYRDWQNWRVFWPAFPVLFYFREVNSIHFLPMLFNSQELLACLQPLPKVD